MGTISANKLGGLALMFAPVTVLILYFLQPGGTFVDAADPASASATIAAVVGNASLAQVLGVLIPLGLLVLLYGVFVLQDSIRSNGNGAALSRLGLLFILVGVTGWVIGSGIGLAIAGSGLAAAQAVPAFAALYSVSVGIGTIAGIVVGIGFLALALAVSTREDSNKIAALVAAVAAAVAVVVTIVGATDSSQLETMSQITGITYLVHMVWFFMLGRNLSKAD
jgi:hypothetical protein